MREKKGLPPPARAGTRPRYSRIVLLAVASFACAIALHAILGAAGLQPEHPARVFLTPIIAAVIILLGMRPVPLTRRLRLAVLAAAGLFIYAMLQ